jgi:branched-chain amino acid transport system ATP-binding protein
MAREDDLKLVQGVGITKTFGGVQALSGVDFEVEKGTIVGLIGPNGAGKTTLFKIVAGAIAPSSGAVRFQGEDITGWSAYKVCRRGIARTFQVTRPFGEMTCLENVAVGVVNRQPGCRRSQWTALAAECLETVGLKDLAATEARHLNVVQKKRLEIARALATRPELLMLDEVLGGLNSQEIQEAVAFIQGLRDQRRLTILWIEHVMGAIMQATEKVIVLDQGKILTTGTPTEVVNDPRVIHAYLGD